MRGSGVVRDQEVSHADMTVFFLQTTISAVLTTDNYSEYFLVKGARRKKMSEIPNDATTSRNLIMLVVGLLITTVAVAAIAAMVAY